MQGSFRDQQYDLIKCSHKRDAPSVVSGLHDVNEDHGLKSLMDQLALHKGKKNALAIERCLTTATDCLKV